MIGDVERIKKFVDELNILVNEHRVSISGETIISIGTVSFKLIRKERGNGKPYSLTTTPGNTLYELFLTHPGDRKIQTIKLVRQVTNWGLAPAKEAVADRNPTPARPVPLGVTLREDEARMVVGEFASVGATVEMRRASVTEQEVAEAAAALEQITRILEGE